MLRRLRRKGLFNRLTARGVHQIVAGELSFAVYPSKDYEPMVRPLVDEHRAAIKVADYLDRRMISYEVVMTVIFGDDYSDRFDEAWVDPLNAMRRMAQGRD